MKLYGPSNITSIQLPSGARHDFRKKEKRHAAPDYGDHDRSLPVIETTHPMDIKFLRKEGWVEDPANVAKTPKEREVIQRAKEEGSVTLQLLTRALAEQSVKQAAQITQVPETRRTRKV